MSSIARATEVLDALRAKAQKRALADYQPSRLQKRAHDGISTHPIVLMIGPNGIGKSLCLTREAVSWIIGFRPWDGTPTRPSPCRIGLFGENFGHALQEDLVPLLKEVMPEDLVLKVDRLRADQPHRWRFKNGTALKLMSYKQPSKDFEGMAWDFVGFNEPPPRHVWIPTVRGLAKRAGKAFFAFTAVGSNSAWLHDELYAPAVAGDTDVIVVHGGRADCFMSDAERARFERSLNDDERAARIEGSWQHLTGRVYREFNRDAHVWPASRESELEEMIHSPSIPKGMVVDPHDRKPFAIAWFLVTPQSEIVFFREWPTDDYNSWRSCDYAVPDYAANILEDEKTHGIHPVVWRIIDPNAGPKRSVHDNRTTVEAFSEYGIAFDHQVEDAIDYGHLEVKRRLRPGENEKPTLFIASSCWNLVHAMESYAYKEPKTGDTSLIREKPSEYCKDFADLVRYACVYRTGYFDPLTIGRDVRTRPRLFGVA